MEYFKKSMEEVTTKELREYLLKYLREERKLNERSVNYYNSVIRFIFDVVLDKPINQKQLPMYKKKRRLPKILSEEELSIFFNCCDNYMYKTIFMMIYGSGLRISEATDIRVEDIDSKNMRLFVRNGKGERERFIVLPEASLEMNVDSYNQIHNANSLVYTYTPTTGTSSTNRGSGYFIGTNGAYYNNGYFTIQLKMEYIWCLVELSGSLLLVLMSSLVFSM